MNEEFSKEDQDWLDVLAGKSPEGLDSISAAQALAIRNALASRRESIEADAVRVGSRGLEEIRARLLREGLMIPTQASVPQRGWIGRALDIFGLGSAGGGTRAVPIWGVAALIVVALLLTFQVRGPKTEEALVYRGDPNAATLIVEKPELRANEIVAGVKAAGSDGVVISRFKEGSIRLEIKDSQAVRDYLLTQRIEAFPVNGIIKIDVVPVNIPPK